MNKKTSNILIIALIIILFLVIFFGRISWERDAEKVKALNMQTQMTAPDFGPPYNEVMELLNERKADEKHGNLVEAIEKIQNLENVSVEILINENLR